MISSEDGTDGGSSYVGFEKDLTRIFSTSYNSWCLFSGWHSTGISYFDPGKIHEVIILKTFCANFVSLNTRKLHTCNGPKPSAQPKSTVPMVSSTLKFRRLNS